MKFCFATDAVHDVQQYRPLDNILNAALCRRAPYLETAKQVLRAG